MGIVLAIVILLLMITVHEFGHYIAGKLLGFKINEFSIGFGPALFKRKSKKSGEQFSVRLIPLGGFCAFAGEDEIEQEEIQDECDLERKNVKESKEIFPDVMQTEEKKDAPTLLQGKNKEEKKQTEGGRFNDMAPWKRIIVLVAGATMNYLLALIFIFVSFGFFGELLVGAYQMEQTDAIAQEYCLQEGDIFLQVENHDIYMTTDLMTALKDRKAGDKVQMQVSRIVDVDADGKNVREKKTIIVQLRADTHFANTADTDKLWQALGFAKELDENGQVKVDQYGNVRYMVASYRCQLGFFETLGRGFVYSIKIATSIFQVLGDLLTGRLGMDVMGGPMTTISVTSEIASRGVQPFLEIASYIGVNLAVFNLLPLPALDGSKTVFTAVEWVRGKPINRKVEAIIHTVGMVLLFAFAILVDLLQFI